MSKQKTTLREMLAHEDCDEEDLVKNLILGYCAASAYSDAQFQSLNDEAKNTILNRLKKADEINAYNHYFHL